MHRDPARERARRPALRGRRLPALSRREHLGLSAGGLRGGYPPVGYAPAAPPNVCGAGKRFGAFLLNIVLMIVTLFIGWIIWSLIVYKDGRTPAYQVLGMRIVDAGTGRPLTWGQSLLRNFVVFWLLGAIPFLGTLYLLVGACFTFADGHQALWDKMVNCYVVND